MTADKIQSIARRMSNQTWCRHWLMYNDTPTVAIQCRSHDGVPHEIVDAERHGLTLLDDGTHARGDYVYVAPRTNEDGTPYVSKL